MENRIAWNIWSKNAERIAKIFESFGIASGNLILVSKVMASKVKPNLNN